MICRKTRQCSLIHLMTLAFLLLSPHSALSKTYLFAPVTTSQFSPPSDDDTSYIFSDSDAVSDFYGRTSLFFYSGGAYIDKGLENHVVGYYQSLDYNPVLKTFSIDSYVFRDDYVSTALDMDRVHDIRVAFVMASGGKNWPKSLKGQQCIKEHLISYGECDDYVLETTPLILVPGLNLANVVAGLENCRQDYLSNIGQCHSDPDILDDEQFLREDPSHLTESSRTQMTKELPSTEWDWSHKYLIDSLIFQYPF